MQQPGDQARIEEWCSKGEIATALAVHSRGVDRADANLLGAAYHPDASVDYGFFVGAAGQLADILAGAQKAGAVTLHRTSNIWIRMAGACARSESCVLAYAETRDAGVATQRFIGGRYLDLHERRDGAWRLSHRRYVMDFNINRPGTSQWPDPPVALAQFAPRGGHAAADPGRALLAQHAAAFSTPDQAETAMHNTADIEQALTKQALHDLNMAHARAVDRADAALMASLFHPDATVVSGVFNGRGPEYAEHITRFVRENLTRCFHSVANEWYEVRGDRAVGETYVITNVTAGDRDVLTGGRYIDAFERRDGQWKIRSRTFVVDWSNAQPSSFEEAGMYASLKTRGCFGEADPVYQFWNS